jgi:thiol-disulfide isomerase/thioredoxin
MRCLIFSIAVSFLVGQSIFAQSSPQKELDSLRSINYEKLERLLAQHKNVFAGLDTIKDPVIKKSLEEKYDSLNKVMDKIWDDKVLSDFDFVQSHLNSPISLEVLQYNLIRPEAIRYHDVIDSLYKQISKNLQNTQQGKQLLEALTICLNNQVGKQAPLFTVKEMNGQLISLKDFYNKKYVLIDFWASWCLPCREEFPYLKEAYAMYNPKGLEIISVSIDENLSKWKESIYKDSIDKWWHFADKENTPSISSLYFVTGVPIKILVDEQGYIIGRWFGNSKENTEALKNKLETIFSSRPQI